MSTVAPPATMGPHLRHEAYLKLLDPAGLGCKERRHFLDVVARAMRQVLGMAEALA